MLLSAVGTTDGLIAPDAGVVVPGVAIGERFCQFRNCCFASSPPGVESFLEAAIANADWEGGEMLVLILLPTAAVPLALIGIGAVRLAPAPDPNPDADREAARERGDIDALLLLSPPLLLDKDSPSRRELRAAWDDLRSLISERMVDRMSLLMLVLAMFALLSILYLY